MQVDPWVQKMPWRRKWQPTPVFLPGESPWTEEPGGLQSSGSQRAGHDRVTAHLGLIMVPLLFWSCRRVCVSSLLSRTSQHWWPLFVPQHPVHAFVEFGKCMAIASWHNSSICFIEILDHCRYCIFLHQSSQSSYGVFRCTQLLTLLSIPQQPPGKALRPPGKALPLGVLYVCFPCNGNEIAFSSDVAQGKCLPGKWSTEWECRQVNKQFNEYKIKCELKPAFRTLHFPFILSLFNNCTITTCITDFIYLLVCE